MKLNVLLPTKVFLEEPVSKVIAEARNGSFCLLPRHVDFVTILVPGILTYFPLEGEERYLALNGGTLVKCGSTIHISTAKAVQSMELETLQKTIDEEFLQESDHEKKARSALLKLEANMIQGFLGMERLKRHG